MTACAWTTAALPDSVGSARRAVSDFLGAQRIPAQVVDDVRLAVSEALTNVVVHAYRDSDGTGAITVSVSVDRAAGLAEVTVTDDGGGLAPRDDSPGLGLGMALIEQLAQAVVYGAPAGGGTEVRMRFRFAAPTRRPGADTTVRSTRGR
ncbi:MAG TPA: ATP-binding protein [Solirubrobacteraceae bacterium]|nr:ATP-binding protein [Solirubrobacteraceae bacterium]